ncbi:hypothetical protein ASA1KI_07650 [Opitutales bacterium ASA1]|uniref:hypothetical protein n=1 Tax=Congregicoccus parvus TaxID=3081749 RepID=UPI002B281A23|nr:hypothetical protein ASA1KI_07650 [Opitutales bacterium ASA1]
MKNRISPALAVAVWLALAATPALHADTEPAPARAYTVKQVGEHVTRGTPRIAVIVHLGRPTEKLGPDIWVYRGFTARNEDSRKRTSPDTDRLVIVFDDGYVREMKLANPEGLLALADSPLERIATVTADLR